MQIWCYENTLYWVANYLTIYIYIYISQYTLTNPHLIIELKMYLSVVLMVSIEAANMAPLWYGCKYKMDDASI